MATKLTKHEAAELIAGMKLSAGGGSLADYRERNSACVMQAVNIYYSAVEGQEIVGSEHGNVHYSSLPTVDPVLEGYMISLNDGITHQATRNQLVELVPALVNTMNEKHDLSDYRERMCKREFLNMARAAYRGNKSARKIVRGFWNLQDEFADVIDLKTGVWNWKAISERQFINRVKEQLDAHFGYETLGDLYGTVAPQRGIEFAKKLIRARNRKAERERSAVAA